MLVTCANPNAITRLRAKPSSIFRNDFFQAITICWLVVSVGWSFVAAALSGGFWHERVCMRRSAREWNSKAMGIDRMQWNALSITAMMGWLAAVSAFFMVANTPVRYAMSRASNAGFKPCAGGFDRWHAPMTCGQSATRSAFTKIAFTAASSPLCRSAWY